MSASTSVRIAPAESAEPTRSSSFSQVASEERIHAVAAALERNGMTVILAADRSEAVGAILRSIPEGSTVLDATSQTLAALDVPNALSEAKQLKLVRPGLIQLHQSGQLDEARRLGAAPDVVVGSVHALTESGQAVIASASGSQLGPYVYAAGKVIWVVGAQKIVPDLETAFRRVEEYTLPLENERAMKAYGRGSAVAKLLIVNREFQPGRITVILLRENLGF